jgi:aminoglycoside phosphotransferase (APT) family kinase protein
MAEATPTTGLEEALNGLVRRRLGGEGAGGLSRVSAGATQEIWRFHMLRGGEEIPLILRRAPGGERVSPTAVGLETEAALIEAAGKAGVPVPPVRWVLRPEDGLGRGFVMGFVEGETLGGRIARGEAFADTRAFLARQCGEILARIHTLDPAPFPNLRRSTPAELVAQYAEIYRAGAWPRPVFELALRWLADRCPPPAAPRLVHGDFRNGNLMVGPEGVRAVLDWEIAHVCDPMEDLGWICVGSWRFGVDDKPVGGFGLREDLWAGYEAAGGAPVRREHALWWEVFGSLRWGVMCATMVQTFRTVDPNVERAVIARRASETEVDLLRLLAA